MRNSSLDRLFDRAMRQANTVGKKLDEAEAKSRERDVREAKRILASETARPWTDVKRELGFSH